MADTIRIPMEVQGVQPPSNIKGIGRVRGGKSITHQKAEKVVEHCVKNNSFGEWFTLGFYRNQSTACSVARGIKRANTEDQNSKDQKVPEGFLYDAGVEYPKNGTEEFEVRIMVRCRIGEDPFA